MKAKFKVGTLRAVCHCAKAWVESEDAWFPAERNVFIRALTKPEVGYVWYDWAPLVTDSKWLERRKTWYVVLRYYYGAGIRTGHSSDSIARMERAKANKLHHIHLPDDALLVKFRAAVNTQAALEPLTKRPKYDFAQVYIDEQ